jgi:hypothetical protein
MKNFAFFAPLRVHIHKALRLVLILVAVLSALKPARLSAQEQPDLASYTVAVREGLAAAQRRDRIGLEAIAPTLIDTRSVQLEDGQLLPVDNRWLAVAIEPLDPNFASIEAQLGTLVEMLALTESAAAPDAQQRLATLLSQPPFADPPASSGWFGQVLDWLFELLARIFEPVADVAPAAGTPLSWISLALAALLIGGVIFYWLRGLRRAMARDANLQHDDDPEANLTASAAMQQAQSIARVGDYRSAVRLLYLSALLWLDERGMLRYDRALTNREYLERLGDNTALRARLSPIIETFDRVWYGYAPIDEAAFADYRRQVEELRAV